ncbi:MAG: preprotein translocase subunit YajC [Acidobacteriota bacterium]|nr:preprotein translocase subunit YajC [Acidobacteriota bacterium]
MLLLQAGGSPLGMALPLILMIAIFYLLVFMPAQRQRKATAKMLRELENGNVVVTGGGIVGTIVSINSDDTLILRVKPDNVKLQMSRSAVTGLVPEEKKS